MSLAAMHTNRLTQARSLLFVPGHRPDRFEKAAASGADAIILDLEDSVPVSSKAAARAAIGEQWPRLQAIGIPVLVRINGSETHAGMEDLAWLGRLSPPVAIVLPKAESAQTVAWLHRTLSGVPVLPIIESAAGYAGLPEIASAPGVLRLVIGHLDFIADTGLLCTEDQAELAPLRFAVAVATRIGRLAPAVDGITEQIDDEQRLRQDVQRSVRYGFGGKLCIHPAQISVVHDAMSPSEAELEWARKVVAAASAANGAAVQVDGRMVDLPVVIRARRLIERAAQS